MFYCIAKYHTMSSVMYMVHYSLSYTIKHILDILQMTCFLNINNSVCAREGKTLPIRDKYILTWWKNCLVFFRRDKTRWHINERTTLLVWFEDDQEETTTMTWGLVNVDVMICTLCTKWDNQRQNHLLSYHFSVS